MHLLPDMPLAAGGLPEQAEVDHRCRADTAFGRDAGLCHRLCGKTNDGGFSLPAIQYQNFDPKYLRQVVYYPSKYPAGTIVVDPKNKFLYLIQPGGRAIRYGIGVGRAGFAWNGEAVIRFKREWPKWFPPDEMIERDPKLEKYRDGQEGGPRNPIGARGLYLWQGNKDTLYRIHSTNQPSSIGTNASSGCIRMWHQDVIDLYDRVECRHQGGGPGVRRAPKKQNLMGEVASIDIQRDPEDIADLGFRGGLRRRARRIRRLQLRHILRDGPADLLRITIVGFAALRRLPVRELVV